MTTSREIEMTKCLNQESMRAPHYGYKDRNDGFMRTEMSRSKWNHTRNTKKGKVKRIKPDHRKFGI